MSLFFHDVTLTQARSWLGCPSLKTFSLTAERLLEQSVVAELHCGKFESSSEGGSILRRGVFLKRAGEIISGISSSNSGGSFASEIGFAAALAADVNYLQHALNAAGVRTPLILYAHNSEEGVCTLVLELLNLNKADMNADAEPFFREVGVAGEAEAGALCEWLARFHAFWWCEAGEGEGECEGWSKVETFAPVRAAERRAQGACWWKAPRVGGAALFEIFTAHCRDLPLLRESNICTPRAVALLTALGAAPVGGPSVAHNRNRTRTLLHGDVKTSNAFFNSQNGAACVFDFQWVGEGHNGAADIAYFIAGGVACISDESSSEAAAFGVDALLRRYWAAFQEGMRVRPCNRAPCSLTWDDFVCAVDDELVLYYKLAAPLLLEGLSVVKMYKNKAKYGWLTHEHDERALLWLTVRVINTLERWVSEGRLEMAVVSIAEVCAVMELGPVGC